MSEFDLIKHHEGLRLLPYECTAGKITIGYGRNLEDKGILLDEAEMMLTHDVYECVVDLKNNFPWFRELSEARMQALVDMRYNLGKMGFRKFKGMIKAIEDGDYRKAAEEMLDSRWANQVGERAHRLADMMANDTESSKALKKRYIL